jgi:hypothetical protein
MSLALICLLLFVKTHFFINKFWTTFTTVFDNSFWSSIGNGNFECQLDAPH